MANKYDLRVKALTLTGGGAIDNVLGKVPDGKTRFIGFIKMCCGADATTITIGECDTDAAIDAPEVRDVTLLAANAVLAYPDGVDVDNPLFSIAEKTYLNVKSSDAVLAGDDEFTVVYYDE